MALNAYQKEILDGHREMVAEFGAPITFTSDASGTVAVLLTFPSASQDAEDAGYQNKAHVGVTLERAQFVAAGVNQDSRFQIVGEGPLVLHVDSIEDDPGQPLVYFTGAEVE